MSVDAGRQAAVSRANGAKSRGPRSAAGKQKSARNSLKHGLFSAEASLSEVPAVGVSQLADELRRAAGENWHALQLIDTVVGASVQLERASTLVNELRGRAADALRARPLDLDLLNGLIEALVRYGRYERRFRGRRDRAVRRVMAVAAHARKAALASSDPACLK